MNYTRSHAPRRVEEGVLRALRPATPQIKVFLAQLVRRYDWVVDVRSTVWTGTTSVSVFPTNGLPTWIEHRRAGTPVAQ